LSYVTFQGNIEIGSHFTNYCLIEVVTKASFTVFGLSVTFNSTVAFFLWNSGFF